MYFRYRFALRTLLLCNTSPVEDNHIGSLPKGFQSCDFLLLSTFASLFDLNRFHICSIINFKVFTYHMYRYRCYHTVLNLNSAIHVRSLVSVPIDRFPSPPTIPGLVLFPPLVCVLHFLSFKVIIDRA